MRFRDVCRLTLACLAATVTLSTCPAHAELSITVDRGNFQPMPIAVTDFGGADPALGQQISGVISNDLKRSGLFLPVDKKAFIEKVERRVGWRTLRSQGSGRRSFRRRHEPRDCSSFRAA